MQKEDKAAKLAILGKRIRQARNQAGLDQKELAERVGMLRTSINSYEMGNTEPPPLNLVAIADALRVPVGFFLEPLSKWNRDDTPTLRYYPSLPINDQEEVDSIVQAKYRRLSK